ncbi:uncharacterized protein LOC113305951 [Papaver somniferum]|uniref:uncharacterized protein LOC113305951 n=1 Tax=Papaver somniferum TaxID=3469 RepID=UPI000E6F8D82|nr:uncharacterized protein LOC113305951 [Papaver somniferum]
MEEQGEDPEDNRRPKRSRSNEEEEPDSIYENNEILNVQNTGRNNSAIEFDDMEHDLIDERENNTRENPHAMDEATLTPNPTTFFFLNIFFLIVFITQQASSTGLHHINCIPSYNSRLFFNMKILSWNSQGFLGRDTRDHLLYLNNLHNPDIIFICETKINENRIMRLSNFLGMPNKIFVPSVGITGGLLYLWKYGFSLNVVYQDEKIIYSRVTNDPCKKEWYLTCMYGTPYTHEKVAQWSLIKNLNSTIVKPWVLIGDLNVTFSPRDRTSKASNTTPSDILELIKDSDLSDLDSIVNHLHQNGSDHTLVLLDLTKNNKVSGRSWKFFEHWVKHNSCIDHIKSAWSSTRSGSNAFVISNKLSNTRHILSLWSKDSFGNINQCIAQLQTELNTLQAADVNGYNTEAVVNLEGELRKLNEIQASSNRQKYKDHFFNDMDMNSRYFHIRMNRRRSRNRIDSLMAPDGSWCSDRDSLSGLLKKHFQDIMITSDPPSSQHFLRHISLEDNEALEAIPTEHEIYQALMKMEPWTSPVPDGLPPGFYMSQLSVVKEDVCNMLISLRMKKHIAKIISPMQSAYVPGRLISENICLVQEIVQAIKKKEGVSGHLALKMDMSKAFDRLEWSFLLDILKHFGFSEEFRQLISQCISTTHIEINLINGSPTSAFNPICGMKISRSAPKINHLFFADDCILFCKANDTQVHNLLQAIHQFSQCSGQLINFNKSTVFFISNFDPENCQNISGSLQVRSLNISDEKYLGLPFFLGRKKHIPFSILCDKMDHRFSNWNGSNMSEATRLVMIKNMSNTIPIHHMTSFKLPDVIIKQMSSKQQKLWRNKKSCKGNHIITWRRTQRPKEEQEHETPAHFLMECNLSRAVWFSITGWISTGTVSFSDWVKSWFGDLHEKKIATDEICRRPIIAWCLWTRRCDKAFQNINPFLERIILKSRSFISDHLTQKTVTLNSSSRVSLTDAHCSSPPLNTATINCDGSFINSTKAGGIG